MHESIGKLLDFERMKGGRADNHLKQIGKATSVQKIFIFFALILENLFIALILSSANL
jgi:hypothetical protein